MLFQSLVTAAVISLAAASPILSRAVNLTDSQFFLVTTSSHHYHANSSVLANASATTLFYPESGSTYLLRLQQPGYSSLPNFTISDGNLHASDYGPHGFGYYEYNTTEVVNGSALAFEPAKVAHGELSLLHGYLLAMNGSANGWTICSSASTLGQSVVSSANVASLRTDMDANYW